MNRPHNARSRAAVPALRDRGAGIDPTAGRGPEGLPRAAAVQARR